MDTTRAEEIEKLAEKIISDIEDFPEGSVGEWDLDNLDTALTKIYGCAEDIERIAKQVLP